MAEKDQICPCEDQPFLPELRIPAGLQRIPRQRGKFADYRRALLAHSRLTESPALHNWAADDPRDLGLIVIEGWAYLLDILSFYDDEIAQENYLGTANRTDSAGNLTDLLGYTPRPAMSSRALLAVQAKGVDPVTLPKGIAFKSAPEPEVPGQVYETDTETRLYPQINVLELQPVRPGIFDGTYWTHPAASLPDEQETVIIRFGDAPEYQVVKFLSADQLLLPDGRKYRKLNFDPPLPTPETELPTHTFNILKTTQVARKTNFDLSDSGKSSLPNSVQLDANYPQFTSGSKVLAVMDAGRKSICEISDTNIVWPKATNDSSSTARFPVTELILTALDNVPLSNISEVRLVTVSIAPALTPFLTELSAPELTAQRALNAPLDPFAGDEIPPTRAMYKGRKKKTVVSAITYGDEPQTEQSWVRLDEPALFDAPLQVPVKIFGNVVSVTQGETVAGEELGSSDGFTPFQEYKLQKKPLTWIANLENGGSPKPELSVYVNGILWKRVETFVGKSPSDQVYRLKSNTEGETFIVFGEHSIPPSGEKNITATYRFGAGKAKPSEGGIAALAGRSEAVEHGLWSTEATGGSDAETAASIKQSAPASMLTFGRPVSMADYLAIARQWPGVRNAQADWSPAPASQRVQVTVWIIPDGSGIEQELQMAVASAGEPDTPVLVLAATAIPTETIISVRIDPDYQPDKVIYAIQNTLSGKPGGFLAPENQSPGASVFKSQIAEKVQQTEGVDAVLDVSLSGSDGVSGLTTPTGHYRDFTPLIVQVTS